MPCRDEGRAEYEDNLLKARINGLAQMLCATCHACDDAGVKLPDNTQPWWDEHKARDNKEALERARNRARQLFERMGPEQRKEVWELQHPRRR